MSCLTWIIHTVNCLTQIEIAVTNSSVTFFEIVPMQFCPTTYLNLTIMHRFVCERMRQASSPPMTFELSSSQPLGQSAINGFLAAWAEISEAMVNHILWLVTPQEFSAMHSHGWCTEHCSLLRLLYWWHILCQGVVQWLWIWWQWPGTSVAPVLTQQLKWESNTQQRRKRRKGKRQTGRKVGPPGEPSNHLIS